MTNKLQKEFLLLKSSNMHPSKQYNDKLTEYDERFYLLLEDYKKFFIASRIETESSEAQNSFKRENSMLANNSNNIFLLFNSVQIANDKINKEITTLEASLKKEREQHKILSEKTQGLENLDNAAVQMLKDKNIAYNERLIKIFNIIVGIVATGILVYKIPSA